MSDYKRKYKEDPRSRHYYRDERASKRHDYERNYSPDRRGRERGRYYEERERADERYRRDSYYDRRDPTPDRRRNEPTTHAYYTLKSDVQPSFFAKLIEDTLWRTKGIDTNVLVEPPVDHNVHKNYKFTRVRILSKYFNELSDLSFTEWGCYSGKTIPSIGQAADPIAPVVTRTGVDVGNDGKAELPSSGAIVEVVETSEPNPNPFENEITVVDSPVVSQVTTVTSTTTVPMAPLEQVQSTASEAEGVLDLSNLQPSNCTIKSSAEGTVLQILLPSTINLPTIKPEKKKPRQTNTGEITLLASGTRCQSGEQKYFDGMELRLNCPKAKQTAIFKSQLDSSGKMKFIVTDEERSQIVVARTPSLVLKNWIAYLYAKNIDLEAMQGVKQRSIAKRLENWFKFGEDQ